MENTANETWINKLVDAVIDSKKDAARLRTTDDQFDILLKLILSNTDLDYLDKELTIKNDTAILEYIKIIAGGYYSKRLSDLQEAKGAERRRIAELAEVTAKEAKGKEEA